MEVFQQTLCIKFVISRVPGKARQAASGVFAKVKTVGKIPARQ